MHFFSDHQSQTRSRDGFTFGLGWVAVFDHSSMVLQLCKSLSRLSPSLGEVFNILILCASYTMAFWCLFGGVFFSVSSRYTSVTSVRRAKVTATSTPLYSELLTLQYGQTNHRLYSVFYWLWCLLEQKVEWTKVRGENNTFKIRAIPRKVSSASVRCESTV